MSIAVPSSGTGERGVERIDHGSQVCRAQSGGRQVQMPVLRASRHWQNRTCEPGRGQRAGQGEPKEPSSGVLASGCAEGQSVQAPEAKRIKSKSQSSIFLSPTGLFNTA